MEVKIGVQHSPRELVVDTDDTPEAVEKLVAEAVAGEGVVTLTDTKGRKVIVPAAKIAYVEIGGGVVGTVGFRS
ncbi:DUF3107 domain-containing protein [Nocardioides rubriscoriae]|uniref:DUF3107 domain-containing protein n=1 Tax=Nocardioides rubriscoriae TaxID=642762 RepID=UPI0011DFAAB7|nr:DUF3107 domain-containing protein [Nocardioides rubriscoriae]